MARDDELVFVVVVSTKLGWKLVVEREVEVHRSLHIPHNVKKSNFNE